jgi:hypothetical protein
MFIAAYRSIGTWLQRFLNSLRILWNPANLFPC